MANRQTDRQSFFRLLVSAIICYQYFLPLCNLRSSGLNLESPVSALAEQENQLEATHKILVCTECLQLVGGVSKYVIKTDFIVYSVQLS